MHPHPFGAQPCPPRCGASAKGQGEQVPATQWLPPSHAPSP